MTGAEAAAVALSPQEFDEIYDRYKTDIYHFICYLAQDPIEAEDMFQEVWLRVVRHRPSPDKRENLKPWLLAVVVNLHRDLLRKKRVRRLFLLSRTKQEMAGAAPSRKVAPVSSDPALSAEQATLQRNIGRALSRLPEKQRRVFLLKEVEGLRQAEIAGILEIPVGTVKSLMHRAVKRLQRELAAYNPKGERLKCDAKMLSV